MDIISRNFFFLLRAGAFGDEVKIEPMSAWKWRRVYQYSLMHSVSALLFDGIERCRQQFFLQLPTDLYDTWQASTKDMERESASQKTTLVRLYEILNGQQLRPILLKGQHLASLYDKPEHRQSHNIEFFFPYDTQARKADKWAHDNGTGLDDSESYVLSYQWNGALIEHHHRMYRLTNRLLNHSLQSIIETDIRESKAKFINIGNTRIEVPSNTLAMLTIILHIAQQMLNNGIAIKLLVDLGIMLRKIGDKVDYVTLQKWIDKLGLKRIAQVSGALLIETLGFSEDEIPFMSAKKETDLQRVLDELFLLQNNRQGDWFFQQGKDIFIHASNSSAMMWHVRQSAHYFKYYPTESITNLVTSFTRSLSRIEE